MGLLDFFGGGTPAQKAQKLKSKITQKYGDATARQKAIATLGEMASPEAVPVLMQRFTILVDPQTTDADEKQAVMHYICDLERDAVPPVVDFLTRSEAASSWALRILGQILPREEVNAIIIAELKRLGAEYTRDPEKKTVLLQALEGQTDEGIGEVAMALLHDMSDDVKIAALKTVASVKYEPAREEILTLLTTDETAKRVQTACLQALFETGFQVQGFREKVEARCADPWSVDRAGNVKKRGA